MTHLHEHVAVHAHGKNSQGHPAQLSTAPTQVGRQTDRLINSLACRMANRLRQKIEINKTERQVEKTATD